MPKKNTQQLTKYAESEISRLGLGDSETNCHGIVAIAEAAGVRLTDGVGLDVLCRTIEEVDRELAEMVSTSR